MTLNLGADPIREIEVLTVLRVHVFTGEGTRENPARVVTYLIDAATGQILDYDDARPEPV